MQIVDLAYLTMLLLNSEDKYDLHTIFSIKVPAMATGRHKKQ